MSDEVNFLMQGFAQTSPVKPMINIGMLLDIPSGTFLPGTHGEMILNGGLGQLTGYVGMGNSFKSTLMHCATLVAMSRMAKSTNNTYDTEQNVHEARLTTLATPYFHLFGGNPLDAGGRWTITDKTVYMGDEWYDKAREFMSNKIKNSAKITVTTPFLDRDKKSLMKMLIPTFQQIDSFSEFSTADVVKMQEENSLGESGANTVSMRQSLQKNRLLMEFPAEAGKSNNFLLTTAHIGMEFNMDPRNPAPKKLSYLKQGIKLKGVPEKYTYVMNNCYLMHNTTPLINQGTKGPEYPSGTDDNTAGDTDLNIVTVSVLRSKSGPSGIKIDLIVSQSEGVLSALSEFHFIKTCERFGLGGNDRNYFLELVPEVALSRTTVRGKLDTNPQLVRAMNICAEMCQMFLLYDLDKELICTPKELYESLKAMGYDWQVLLNTRGWWTYDNDKQEVPFLSTMDLLRMRVDQYVPYWYPKELKDKLKLKT
jgi:hypothetical protein